MTKAFYERELARSIAHREGPLQEVEDAAAGGRCDPVAERENGSNEGSRRVVTNGSHIDDTRTPS